MATTPTLEHGQPLPGHQGERRTGPYLLLERLGEGGMGEVWLAEQSAPVQRQVALKLIRAGMDSRRVVSRFASERQTLALMEHPAIAKVFDGGQTTDGRPWFAMELVRGEPINKHCDAQQLTTRERLELFARVCDGVQHAHQKAIIHRDLKPSNVLISTFDGKAHPKIIDFGIAKATGRERGEGALTTELGTVLGTPEYMSPEQADPATDDIDTRADVYSLGAMLYELLCGSLPFSSRELRTLSVEALRRTLLQVDPPAPSARLADRPGRARELRGDLDAVVMKSLEKDRSRRYQSPAELAADLTRYLRGEPVLARAASPLYRLRKLVRRHRALAAFAGAVAALVIGFGVILALQVRALGRERDRANALALLADKERLAAQKQRAAAEELVQFLVVELKQRLEPLGYLDLLVGVGGQVDRYYRDARPSDDAASAEELRRRASALDTLASVESHKHHGEAAESLYRASLAARQLAVARAPASEDALGDLAESELHLGRFLFEQFKPDEAAASASRALALAERLGGAGSPRAAWLVAGSRARLLQAELALWRGEDYTASLQRALDDLTALRGRLPDDTDVLQALAETAMRRSVLDYERGSFDNPSLRQAVEVQAGLAARAPANVPWTRQLGRTQLRLALAQRNLRHLDEALATAHAASAIFARQQERDPEDLDATSALALSQDAICSIYVEMHQPGRARDACRRAVALGRSIRAIDPTALKPTDALLHTLLRLGSILEGPRTREEANAAYVQALDIAEDMHRRDPASTRWSKLVNECRMFLAEYAYREGRRKDALLRLDPAIDALTSQLGGSADSITQRILADALLLAAKINLELRRLPRSRERVEAALDLLERQPRPYNTTDESFQALATGTIRLADAPAAGTPERRRALSARAVRILEQASAERQLTKATVSALRALKAAHVR